MQVPVLTMLSTPVLVTVQTLAVVPVKLTARPEEALAESCWVLELKFCVPGLLIFRRSIRASCTGPNHSLPARAMSRFQGR